ncbi:MAG: hypothetical protein KGL39_26005 [Patescibacteria group bacterium]|nr:hypothetical protein [Patescibacteria group bacterium]
MLRTKLLPTASGVQSGRTATFNLDIGSRYQVIWLEFGNTAVGGGGAPLASLTGDIRVKINGNVQRTFTPIEADAIYGLYGAAFKSQATGTGDNIVTRLPIWFAEPWRKNNSEVPLTAWNIDPTVKSFQIEVDIPAGIASPTLGGVYEFDALTGVLGGIIKWIRQDLPAVGTVQDFNQLDKKEFINAIHLFPTVEGTPKYVNKIRFTANGNDVRDLIDYLENRTSLAGRELVPDTSAAPRFDLVFDYDDPINNALLAEGLTEMTLHLEYNAAANGNLPCTIERTGPPA